MRTDGYTRGCSRLAGVAVVGSLMAMAGCSSVIYDSDPESAAAAAEEKPDYATQTVRNLLSESVSWAVENYPPPDSGGQEWFAINMPRGLTREQYISVAKRVSDRAAPITPDLGYLPTYHIGWVWMRGDEARVDVFRPVYSLSRGSDTVYQAITLYLHRRYSSWRVERTQPWQPGVVSLPPLYYLPAEQVVPGAEAPEAGEQAGPADEPAAPSADETPAEAPASEGAGEE